MKYFLLLLTALFVQAGASGAVLCNIGSTGTAFGGFHTGTGAKDVVGTIAVTCSGTFGAPVSYHIALSPGAGSFAGRAMKAGSSQLVYNLYSDGAHSAIWGDGTSGTIMVSDNYTLTTGSITRYYTIYGEIPGQSGPTVGSYMDTIVITLTY